MRLWFFAALSFIVYSSCATDYFDSVRTTFKIISFPSSTPADASLFITGDFCNWEPGLGRYRLMPDENGVPSITISHLPQNFKYKFTRGTWDAVEARNNGRARANRSYVYRKNDEVVRVEVKSWEDISMRTYVLYMYALIIIGAQGIILIFAVNSISSKTANRTFSVLVVLVLLALFGRASTFDPTIFNWFPKLILLPDIILFTYAPVLYIFFLQLFEIPVKSRRWWIMAVPVVVQTTFYIPHLFRPNLEFIYFNIDNKLAGLYAVNGIVALVFNAYFMKLFFELRQEVQSRMSRQELAASYWYFFRTINYSNVVLMSLWCVTFFTYLLHYETAYDLLTLAEVQMDVLWLVFGLMIFVFTFFVIRYSLIFRLNKKYQNVSVNKNENDEVKQKLAALLDNEKIYKDPELTLASLSYKIPTSPHTLSRVINESYHCTFSSLVNKYRINEFIQLFKEKENTSILGVAYEVGFQSKATFNRAFKKEKGVSPSQFFRKQITDKIVTS